MEEVSERTSSALGLKYINVKGNFLTETGVLFPHDAVRGLSPREIVSIYRKNIDGTLYDYEYAKSTGHIRRHKSQDMIREEAHKRLKEHIPSIEIHVGEEVEKKAKKKRDPMLTAIRVGMALVSAGTSLLSCLYTFNFLMKTNSFVVSATLSSSMILFSVLAFAVIVYFWKHRRFLLSFVFSVMWVIVVSFSMFSTMDVNYGGYKKLEARSMEDNRDTNKARVQIAGLERELSSRAKELEAKQQTLVLQSSKENSPAWLISQLSSEIRTLSSEVKRIEGELQKLYESSPESVITEEVRETTLYDNVESITGIKAGAVHFYVHMLPAIFIDIIAPLSFSVATFLGRREEDEQESKGIRGAGKAGKAGGEGFLKKAGDLFRRVAREVHEAGRPGVRGQEDVSGIDTRKESA